MPDQKISAMTSAATLTGAELVPVIQFGVNRKATTQSIANLAKVAFVGDSGAGGVMGMVPAPTAGDAAAGKILGANGTWVSPPDAAAIRRQFVTVVYDSGSPFIDRRTPRVWSTVQIP